MIQVELRTEIGHDPIPPIIVAVEFHGIQGHGAHENTTYFQVSSEIEVGHMDTTDRTGVPGLEFEVIPISEERAIESTGGVAEGAVSRHFLKARFRRDVNMGMTGSATVSLVGWNRESESRLTPATKARFLEKISKFYEVAVDVLGVGYMGFTNSQVMGGVQIGRVEVAAGVSWDVAKPLTIRLTLGAEGEAMAGVAHGGGAPLGAGLGLQTGVFAKLELLLNTLYGHYALFVMEQYERIDLISGAENPGSGDLHLQVGIRGEF